MPRVHVQQTNANRLTGQLFVQKKKKIRMGAWQLKRSSCTFSCKSVQCKTTRVLVSAAHHPEHRLHHPLRCSLHPECLRSSASRKKKKNGGRGRVEEMRTVQVPVRDTQEFAVLNVVSAGGIVGWQDRGSSVGGGGLLIGCSRRGSRGSLSATASRSCRT